jgi:hypothetical protein
MERPVGGASIGRWDGGGSMRVFPAALGALWFLLFFAVSYRLSAAPRPAIEFQPGALAVPGPTQAPAAVAGDAGSSYVISTAPEPEPVERPVEYPEDALPPPEPLAQPVREPAHVTPLAPLVQRAVTAPRIGSSSRARRTRRTAETPRPARTSGQESAACLVCGARAASWVEVDGQRVGYCRAHYSAPEGAAGAEDPPSAGGEGPSAQCRGVTRSGARCRRKTRDPSGFCYQHRR